jgi:peptidoglycan hydrolase-like protein with peptidoglycan-binding domain
MNNTVADSLAKIRLIESTEVLNESTAAPVAQAASKGIGRFIPGVGAALGAYDAYGRAKQGDWAGAGLSALGGAASLIPGIGTAASLGIAGAQALRDKQRTGSYMPGDDEIAGAVAKDKAAQPAATAPAAAPSPAGADPKVLALQKQLIAKGAKITADGKMGPQTQAAMKQFPGVAVAEQNKGNDMSESQRIAELRDRLAQLESQPQIADEGIADLAKGAWQGVKTVGKNLAGGFKGDAARTAKGTYAAGGSAAGVANKVGKVAGNNKGKLGLATGAAAGAGTMAALSGGAANKPADPTGNKPPAASGGPAAPAAAPAADPAAAPAASSLTTDEEGEMGVLAQELGSQMGRLPELDALLLQYEKLRPGAINAAP